MVSIQSLFSLSSVSLFITLCILFVTLVYVDAASTASSSTLWNGILETVTDYRSFFYTSLTHYFYIVIGIIDQPLRTYLPSGIYTYIVIGTKFINNLTFSQYMYSLLGYIVWMVFYRTNIETKQIIPSPVLKGWQEHAKDAVKVHNQFTHFLKERKPDEKVSINRSRNGHSDSNRTTAADYKKLARRVDVSNLDGVIAIDKVKGLMHIEPGLPMDEMARIAIAYGVVPEVVLEFPGITAGGALCGGGIESTSHKYGSFADTVEEVDIITGDGQLRISVSRTNEPDLFAAIATSYGTHGILTRIAVRVEPAPKFIHVRYLHMNSLEKATNAMSSLANEGRVSDSSRSSNNTKTNDKVEPPAFIDGVAMSPTSAMVVIGDGVNEPPVGVPFRSLRNNRSDPWFFWHLTSISRKFTALGTDKPSDSKAGWREDAQFSEYMTLDDYLFRFDRGAFWMARHGLQVFYGKFAYNPASTSSAGPSLIIRIKYAWLATTRQLYRMLHAIGDEGLARMYVVQDYIMPGPKEACQLAEYTNANSIGIWPLWICPVRMVTKRHASNAGFGFPVQQTKENGLMYNVGVYGLPNNGNPFDPVVLNHNLENKATDLGGRKMLYAQSFYSDDEFWSLFDRKAYETIRTKYQGQSIFPDIHTKLLLGKRMEKMKGAKAISFFSCAGAMALWYFSLWVEMCTPRIFHNQLKIEYTCMSQYAVAPSNAPHVTTDTMTTDNNPTNIPKSNSRKGK